MKFKIISYRTTSAEAEDEVNEFIKGKDVHSIIPIERDKTIYIHILYYGEGEEPIEQIPQG